MIEAKPIKTKKQFRSKSQWWKDSLAWRKIRNFFFFLVSIIDTMWVKNRVFSLSLDISMSEKRFLLSKVFYSMREKTKAATICLRKKRRNFSLISYGFCRGELWLLKGLDHCREKTKRATMWGGKKEYNSSKKQILGIPKIPRIEWEEWLGRKTVWLQKSWQSIRAEDFYIWKHFLSWTRQHYGDWDGQNQLSSRWNNRTSLKANMMIMLWFRLDQNLTYLHLWDFFNSRFRKCCFLGKYGGKNI